MPAAHWRSLAALSWPVFLSTTFGILYVKIDTPLLRAFRDSSAVGVYTLGHRGLDVLAMVPAQFATALFPAMVRAAAVGRPEFERISERSLRFLHLIVLPLTLLCALAAAPLTMWLAKGESAFGDSVIVFRIVVWGLPFMAAMTVLNRMLFTAGRERDFIAIALVSLGVNLGLNVILIPRFGYFGASVAVVASVVDEHRHALVVRAPRRAAPADHALAGARECGAGRRLADRRRSGAAVRAPLGYDLDRIAGRGRLGPARSG